MAKKVIELEVKTNLPDAEGSVKSLRQQLREAQQEVASLSDKFGATSQEAINAAKNAAILKDKISDAKMLTDAFNPDAKFKALSGSLAGVAGGLSAVTGAFGLLGAESGATEEAILKVQSAMAIASGAQQLGESIDSFKQLKAVVGQYSIVQKISTGAQWLWNAAMEANPVGAVVVAITALIAAGYALVNWYKTSTDASLRSAAALKNNTAELKNQSLAADKTSNSLKLYNDYQIDMAKASGASSDAVRKLELKLIDEEIAFANSSREIAKNTYYKNLNILATKEASGASSEEITAQKELTQKSLEEFGKRTKDLNDANSEKIALIRKHNIEIKQTQTDHNKESIKIDQEANKKKVEDLKAHNKEIREAIKNDWDEFLQLTFDNDQELFDYNYRKARKEMEATITTADEKNGVAEQRREAFESKWIKKQEILDETHNKNTSDNNEKLRDLLYNDTKRTKEYKDAKNEEELKQAQEHQQKLLNDQRNADLAKYDELVKANNKIEDAKPKKEVFYSLGASQEEIDAARQEQDARDEEEKARLTKQKDDRQAILDFYNQKESDNNKAWADASIAVDKEVSDKRLAVEEAYKEAKRKALDTGLEILMQFAGKNKAVAIGIIAVQKGLAIADIIIGAAKSIGVARAALTAANSEAMAASPLTGGQPFVGINTGQTLKGIATTKITAAASIASILAAGIGQISSVSSGGGDSGGSSAPSTTSAPTYNVVGTSATNILATQAASTKREAQGPIKAYVVASDVTTAQGLDRNIIKSATIG